MTQIRRITISATEAYQVVKLSASEWAACRFDAGTLLEHLGNSGWHTERKFRLFCCAATRRMVKHLDFDAQGLIAVAERDAEGLAEPAEVADALARLEERRRPQNNRTRRRLHGRLKAQPWRQNALYALFMTLNPSWNANAWRSAVSIAKMDTWTDTGNLEDEELSARVELVHDIFENPFSRASQQIDPRQQSSTVVALARGIAVDQAFDRLPILADALEESGCVDPAVLAHCRGRSLHVRGCWVVDLLLNLGVAYYAEPSDVLSS